MNVPAPSVLAAKTKVDPDVLAAQRPDADDATLRRLAASKNALAAEIAVRRLTIRSVEDTTRTA